MITSIRWSDVCGNASVCSIVSAENRSNRRFNLNQLSFCVYIVNNNKTNIKREWSMDNGEKSNNMVIQHGICNFEGQLNNFILSFSKSRENKKFNIIISFVHIEAHYYITENSWPIKFRIFMLMSFWNINIKCIRRWFTINLRETSDIRSIKIVVPNNILKEG